MSKFNFSSVIDFIRNLFSGGGSKSNYKVYKPDTVTKGIVVWGNGTGVSSSSVYKGIISHLVDNGYVVVGLEDPMVGSGREFVTALNDAIKEHNLPAVAAFTAGHSQGGMGALNALSQTNNFLSAIAIQPAPASINANSKILFIAGSKDPLVRPELVERMFNRSASGSMYAENKNAGHLSPAISSNFCRDLLVAWLDVITINSNSAKQYLDSLMNDDEWIIKVK